ncbi:MAG: HEPN domain-containing protein [Planctomycetes bacterium]|nr:HEPN domain-containing protein [Planctomycetota bacterium]
MSQPQRLPPNDPREWLNRARSNLARAGATRGVPDVYLEDICFDAQQAAEKAIKAVVVSKGVDFPKIHDIADLLSLVSESGVPVPPEVAAAAELTDYAVVARYPSAVEPTTEEDCDAAIQAARAVFEWACGVIGVSFPDSPEDEVGEQSQ